jgi:hypothetical protein
MFLFRFMACFSFLLQTRCYLTVPLSSFLPGEGAMDRICVSRTEVRWGDLAGFSVG